MGDFDEEASAFWPGLRIYRRSMVSEDLLMRMICGEVAVDNAKICEKGIVDGNVVFEKEKNDRSRFCLVEI